MSPVSRTQRRRLPQPRTVAHDNEARMRWRVAGEAFVGVTFNLETVERILLATTTNEPTTSHDKAGHRRRRPSGLTLEWASFMVAL